MKDSPPPQRASSLARCCLPLILPVLLTSLCQGQSAVGFVNKVIVAGRNLVANPLIDFPDNLNQLMPFAPDGTVVYRWDWTNQAYVASATRFDGVGWITATGETNAPALIIHPGEGFWVESPVIWTNTFVGAVDLYSHTNAVLAEYNLLSCTIPVAGYLSSDPVNFPARSGDQVWKWESEHAALYSYGSTWSPTEPVIDLVEGLIVRRDASQATRENWWIQEIPAYSPPANQLVRDSMEPSVQITNLTIESGEIVLEIGNPQSTTFDLEFSSDKIEWQPIAVGLNGTSWRGNYPGGVQGYFRVTTP